MYKTHRKSLQITCRNKYNLGALIDARLSEMDTEQIEYTQLNQKLLQCLHLYDTLMQQEQFSNPYMLNQQMGNMSIQVRVVGFSKSRD